MIYKYIHMKRLCFITLLLLSAHLSQAQSWGNPVITESVSGTGGNIGTYSSMLIVNGNPAIAYYDITHQNLMFMRATDPSGSTWAAPIALDITGDVGSHTSLQIVNGNPAVSYFDFTNSNLKYVRANDASGTSWSSPMTVDAIGNVGYFSSLQVSNGNPCIAYHDAGTLDLKYIRATDVNGTSWSSPQTLDATGIVGEYISMQIINSNPAISYYDRTNGNLKYIRATDASGSTWGLSIAVDAPNDVGMWTSLLSVNGNPSIAYYDGTNANLKFVRANDASGITWGSPSTLDASGSVGLNPALQVVNGNPAICYYDYLNADLKYIRATNASGSTWTTSIILDAAYCGGMTSLNIVNGNPGIVYSEYTNYDLRFLRAADVSGISWNSPLTLDGPTLGNWSFSSIQMVNGNPAIAYRDVINQDLKYVRATSPSGGSWANAVIVDQIGNVGSYTSLQTVSGNPAISYFDITNGNLKFARASDITGTTWASPINIDITGVVGEFNSLQTVNGNPAIAYYDQTNADLKYIRASNSTGSSWNSPVTIDAGGNVGQFTSLLVVNGNPAIAYYDVTNTALKYIRATDASGTSWSSPVYVELSGNVGQYCSLQIVNGFPAIAYLDVTNGNLKYVRANDASGAVWGAPTTIDASGGYVGQYNSLQIIYGNPAVAYQDGTNMNLKYLRALDALGNSWPAPSTLIAQGNTGFYSSMVSMGYDAGIAYIDQTEGFPCFLKGTWVCTNPGTPSLALSSPSICSGNNCTLSVSSGTLNDAFNWIWYTGSCGGSTVGVGQSLTVSPGSSTNYYARGEGGCVTPGPCSTISIQVEPTPSISVNSGSICAGNSFTISPSGANAYTIQGGLAIVSPTASASYSVIGSSTAGCISPFPVTASVGVFPLPTITVNNGIICSGQSFTILPGGANTYTIQGSLAVVSPTINSNYTVAGTSSAGCLSAFPAISSISVNPLPTISINSGTICSGQNFTLIPGGASTYTFSSGFAVVNPPSNASFSVMGTNTAGCISSSPAISNVVVNPLPVIIVNSGAICSGQSFTIIPSGASSYSYEGGSAIVSPTNPVNTYSVSGTSAAGCVSSFPAVANVIVNPLPTITVNSASICSGQTITLIPGGANSYTFSSGSSQVSPTISSTYSVSGASSAGCISASAAVSSITVYPLPIVSVTSGTICTGQSFTLVPSGAVTYTNIGFGNSMVVNPSTNSSYSILGTNIQGCVSASAAIANLTVYPLPVISVNNGTICIGKSFTISPAGASSYTYPGGSAVVSPVTTTSYTISGTGAQGCINMASLTVQVLPLPYITVSGTVAVLCQGESISLSATGATSYTWNTGLVGSIITFTPISTTSISVSGTDATGCQNTALAVQVVDPCVSVIESVASHFEWIVFPNPSSGEFSLEVKKATQFSIYNTLGQVILRDFIEEGINKINICQEAKGVYYMELNQAGFLTRLKLIKE